MPSSVINCAAYAEGHRVGDVSIPDISDVLRQPDRLVWLGLFEPEEGLLKELQREFGLHDLAIEDAHNAHQRPKIEQYERSLFVVLRTVSYVGHPQRLEFGETHIFIGTNYVVTVRHGSMVSHVNLRSKCEATPHLLALGPGYILYMLMDFIVDQYFPIVEAIEDALEQLEDDIFDDSVNRDTTGRIYDMRRDLLSLKRAVSPLVDMCNRLTRVEYDLVPEGTRPYFRDVHDHVVRINEQVDNLREILSTALEAHLSLIAVSQNEDTKRLAAWAAIFGVATMIAGIYGMNFTSIPELGWRYGYAFALLLMVGAGAGLYTGFRRSGWL